MKISKEPTVETTVSVISDAEELDFPAVTRLIGREPTWTRSINRVTVSGVEPAMRISEWKLSTGAQVVNSLDDGIQNLFSLLGENVGLLAQECNRRSYRTSVWSRVTIHDWDDRPFLELSRASLGDLSLLEASWNLEVIDLTR